MPTLIASSLQSCKGFSGESLRGIQALKKLEYLNLNGIGVLCDEIVSGIITQCSKLQTLKVVVNENRVTSAILPLIRAAMIPGQSELRQLAFTRKGSSLTAALAKPLSDEFPHLKISFIRNGI